jgi:hypothetical protein
MIELELVELGNPEHPSFRVREVHAAWSASAQQMEWKSFEDQTYGSSHEAQHSFAQRWKAASKAGFSYRMVLG